MGARVLLKGLLTAVLAIGLTGCAAISAPGNYGGRSGVQQRLLAETVDESVERFGLGSRFTDKKVYLEVGDLEAEGVVNDYVRAAVLQELMRAEATVTSDALEAEEQLVVRVRTAGVDNNDVPKGLLNVLLTILMYQETMMAESRLEAVSVSVEPGSGRVRPNSVADFSGSAEHQYRETWYLFGLIGPMISSSVDSW